MQWIVIAILILVVAGIAYLLVRVFRTLDKVDRYMDRKEEEGQRPASSTENELDPKVGSARRSQSKGNAYQRAVRNRSP